MPDNFISITLCTSAYINTHVSISDLVKMAQTMHLSDERRERLAIYNKNNEGAKIVKVFECDKGHPAGPELHVLTDKGYIYIINKRKFMNGYNCLITVLCARKQQFRRYFEATGLRAPENIIKICGSRNGLNQIDR